MTKAATTTLAPLVFAAITTTVERTVRTRDGARVGDDVIEILATLPVEDPGTQRLLIAAPEVHALLRQVRQFTALLPISVIAAPELPSLRKAAASADAEELLDLESFLAEPTRGVVSALPALKRDPRPLLAYALAALRRGEPDTPTAWAAMILLEVSGELWSGQILWAEILRRLDKRPAGKAVLAAIWGASAPIDALARKIGKPLPATAGGLSDIEEKIAAGVADLWAAAQAIARKHGDWLRPALQGDFELTLLGLKRDVQDRWRQWGRDPLAWAEERDLLDTLPEESGATRVTELRMTLEMIGRRDPRPSVQRLVEIVRSPGIENLAHLARRMRISRQRLNGLLGGVRQSSQASRVAPRPKIS